MKAAALSTVSIVLVEDEDTLLRVLAAYLRAKGYVVHAARDGQAGLALIREHHPDVVVTDLNMPRMDGRAMARSLRVDPDTRDIPVLAITSDDRRTPGDARLFDQRLSKPVRAAALSEAIRTAVCP